MRFHGKYAVQSGQLLVRLHQLWGCELHVGVVDLLQYTHVEFTYGDQPKTLLVFSGFLVSTPTISIKSLTSGCKSFVDISIGV